MWVECLDGCGDYWCTQHGKHAHLCECPEISEWPDGLNPYRDDLPDEVPAQRAGEAGDGGHDGQADTE